jgi:hypothetical protein
MTTAWRMIDPKATAYRGQAADLGGPFWAEVVPDGTGWSWDILAHDPVVEHSAMIYGGNTPTEEEAKRRVEHWRPITVAALFPGEDLLFNVYCHGCGLTLGDTATVAVADRMGRDHLRKTCALLHAKG